MQIFFDYSRKNIYIYIFVYVFFGWLLVIIVCLCMHLLVIISVNKTHVLVSNKWPEFTKNKGKINSKPPWPAHGPRLPWWRPTPHNCTTCPKALPGEKKNDGCEDFPFASGKLNSWSVVCLLSIRIHLKIGGQCSDPYQDQPYTWADSKCGSNIAPSTPRVGMCCSEFLLHAWQLASVKRRCRQLLAHRNGNI